MTKLRIYTFSHKRPDFIEMQINSIKKHLVGDYEFILFNNANFDKDRTNYNQIHQVAQNNKLQCIDVEKDQELIKKITNEHYERIFNSEGMYFNAGQACSYPLCYAWRNYIATSEGISCIIDSDMFLVDTLDIRTIMEQYDLVYMPQSRGNGVEYMWNGLVFMNLNKMPEPAALDWGCGHVKGEPCDVGGHTFHYLNKHKDSLKIKEFQLHYIGEDTNCNFSPANYEYLGLNDVKYILHARGGSNWDLKSKDYWNKKTYWLKTIVEK